MMKGEVIKNDIKLCGFVNYLVPSYKAIL